jgi:hypothetical protein
MPRRHNRRVDTPLPRSTGGHAHREAWRGDEWVVRSVSGQAAAKPYRCPGCLQEIRPGVPHVVAWPAESSADDRRHWHSACWAARDRRPPQ